MARRGAARVAGQIGAVLLAAGASRRMGAANKLLIEVDGVPMVAHAADAIRAAGLPMIVVLGWEAEGVRTALSRERGSGTAPKAQGAREGAAFVEAPDWADGMGSSLAAGIRAVPAHWSGAIVCLGDMPFITADLLQSLATALDRPAAVAVPVHAGQRGNPVAWGHAWFPDLALLSGDSGGRALLARATVREIAADAAIHADLDTPGDLAAHQGWHARARPANSAPTPPAAGPLP